jgi:hypothetical protein
VLVARALPFEDIGHLNFCIVLDLNTLPIFREFVTTSLMWIDTALSQSVLKPTDSRMIARYAWMNCIHINSTLVPATVVHRANARTEIHGLLIYSN